MSAPVCSVKRTIIAAAIAYAAYVLALVNWASR